MPAAPFWEGCFSRLRIARLMTSHCIGRCRTHGMEAAERDNPSPMGGYEREVYQKPLPHARRTLDVSVALPEPPAQMLRNRPSMTVRRIPRSLYSPRRITQ